MKTDETIRFLESEKAGKLMTALYGEKAAGENILRYQNLVKDFKNHFPEEDVLLFTSPGRTEISGNHTDHNHGKVLAGSINLDCVGVAAKNNSSLINIVSVTYNQSFTIDLDDLAPSDKKAGTIDLVKGLLKGFLEKGYEIGGFNAYITSNVISAAGVSSSASFEMLLCSILNTFFNDSRMDTVAYAHIGRYAENVYWDKASGLLDQMACAVGGLITIDFKDPLKPAVEQIDFDFASQNHSLIIVNTGKGHADLSADYSSVPEEMKKVAEFFGKEVCADITEEDVIGQLSAVREFAGDRSVLRALHFFEENKRVDAEVTALKEGRFDEFLLNITASGNSSWKWLQNCFTNTSFQEQGITVALALTELFIAGKKRGACRIHGGGFAGVIMAVLPNEITEEYISYMETAMGEGNAYRMSIRPYGSICFNTVAEQ
ncbi:galactokinase [Lacrimispora xylanisolvens]|uniref:Galactokinase n=1 Tax=Lacrimispora xylanisolvens TaxID=384636 RepID=A0A2S6HXA2_9FIRM|nr:galactokinase family protein [Hungatella xylanolytica]MBE5987672.1 galactokinase [Paenibacillaceae bacterium]PPK82555.1 galactokinase [Hungatella xylanolytica]